MSIGNHINDIRNEPLLSKKWVFPTFTPSAYNKGLLITGANSFIGTHIVNGLQQQPVEKVHLLLRATTEQEAVQKMRYAFKKWELGFFNAEKFSIHLGDVTQNRMGLKNNEYTLLKKEVGFVLHLALNSMHNLPYTHFQRLWLPELERMITFCSDEQFPKSLHYLSSYHADIFSEERDFKQINTNIWQSGYAGFKWVASKTLHNAIALGLRGCLYDIPMVLGSYEKGVCPAHYAIWQLINLFLKTKMYINFGFKIIPVDVLSEVIVTNILSDIINKGDKYLRPVLNDGVTHNQLDNMVANILGLQHVSPEVLSAAYHDKQKFNFIVPNDFHSLFEKVNVLRAIWPESFMKQNLPSASTIFMINLNRILSRTKH